MRYQLIAPVSPAYSSIEQVLINRGIYDIRHYLNTTDADIASFKLFGEERLKRAAIALMRTIDNNCIFTLPFCIMVVQYNNLDTFFS